MLKRYQDTVGDIFRAADGCIMVVAWLASYWGRFFLPPFDVTKGLPAFATYAALAPLIAVLWVAVFTWMHVYESRRRSGILEEVRLIFKAHFVAVLCFISLTYLFEDYKYSRLVMLYFGALGFIALALFRMCMRSALRRLRARGFNLRYTLGVGEGPALESVIARIENFPELGIRVKGVVTQEGSAVTSVGGAGVVGHFAELRDVIQQTHVDEVIIALPAAQTNELDRLLDMLKDQTLDVRLVPDVHRYVTLGCEVENFDGFPIVRLNDSPMAGWGAFAKRATDILASAAALLLLSPLLLLIAMLVKLNSRGPVLYSQERMGLDGHTFKMLKFRSMRDGAEQATGAVWAKQIDDRRTPLGTLLRKTSLDELPQFWNVLCGDMSLVGPRPERPVFVHKFRSEIPFYMLRHKVKAGITGWAQVNGWRGDTSLDRRIECDLFYIRTWSYWMDIKILFITLWKGFVNKNAY
ncbi:MAG: undecaprenyl-phosphate glucose phosphotransferase [Polyangiales bacterium]